MKKISLVVLLLTNIVFANTDDLTIKVEINKELSTKYLAFFILEIKNNTQDWQQLKNKKVSFGTNADKYIEVLHGRKLTAYFEYLQEKQENDDSSNNIFTMALAFINPLTLFASTTSNMMTDRTNLSSSDKDKYPKGHLYRDTLIPPELTVKRFLVISSKNHIKYGYLNSFKFNNKDLKFRASLKITEKYDKWEDMQIINYKYPKKMIWQSDLPKSISKELD
jgi:hypothetical protein